MLNTRLYDGASYHGPTPGLPTLKGHWLKQARRTRRINRRHKTHSQEKVREEEVWHELWLQAEKREQELLEQALKVRSRTDEPDETYGCSARMKYLNEVVGGLCRNNGMGCGDGFQ